MSLQSTQLQQHSPCLERRMLMVLSKLRVLPPTTMVEMVARANICRAVSATFYKTLKNPTDKKFMWPVAQVKFVPTIANRCGHMDPQRLSIDRPLVQKDQYLSLTLRALSGHHIKITLTFLLSNVGRGLASGL